MYRVIGKRGKYYALEIDSIDEDDIKEFLDSLEPVIICNDIDELECFNISPDEVEIVNKYEEDD